MNRTLPSRLFALFLALTFVSAIAGREAGHARCPVHDRMGLTLAAATAAAAGDVSAEHAGHDQAAAEQHDSQSSHDGHEGGCSCLGTCSVGGVVAQTPVATFTLFAQTNANRRIVSPAETRELPGSPEFARPFASGPPVSLQLIA